MKGHKNELLEIRNTCSLVVQFYEIFQMLLDVLKHCSYFCCLQCE